jgi:hypothetical protein
MFEAHDQAGRAEMTPTPTSIINSITTLNVGNQNV